MPPFLPFFPSVLFTTLCSAFSLLLTPLLHPVTFSILLPTTLCSAAHLSSLFPVCLPHVSLYFRFFLIRFIPFSLFLSFSISEVCYPPLLFNSCLLPRTLCSTFVLLPFSFFPFLNPVLLPTIILKFSCSSAANLFYFSLSLSLYFRSPFAFIFYIRSAAHFFFRSAAHTLPVWRLSYSVPLYCHL